MKNLVNDLERFRQAESSREFRHSVAKKSFFGKDSSRFRDESRRNCRENKYRLQYLSAY